MTALVGSSASAQAVEIDFVGEKVRSNPATGATLAPAFGVRPTGRPVMGSQQAASMLRRCSSVTTVPSSTPRPSSNSASPAPMKRPGGVPEAA